MLKKVLAVDLGGTKVALAIVDARGRILARKSEPVDLTSTRAPVDQICRIARELASHGERGSRPSRPGNALPSAPSWPAVGVAVPGLARRNGTVWAPNLPGWKSVPLARWLESRLEMPVVVESDRNAAVSGEAWRGAGQGKSDVISLIVGTGIGAGIMSNGKLVRGAHELSGCAGWLVISAEDSKEFRRVGCLEALVAGPAIARAARAAAKSNPKAAPLAKLKSALEVAEAARWGNRTAKEIFRRAGRNLGLAVANLISLFDPQVVAIGGGLAQASDLYFAELRRTALGRCQPLAGRKVRIAVSPLGNDANLLGIASLALKKN